jgi:tetratricopeptide (TPR) repeat protein
VDAALEGSVAVSSGRVRINVHLIYAQLEHPLWSQSYERALSDIVSLQREIALAVAHPSQLTLTPSERMRLAKTRPVYPRVQLAYSQGYYLYWNRRTPEDLQRAIQYFQSAVHDDPAYAPAFVGLARSYHVMGAAYSGTRSPVELHPMERAAAQKAVEVDPDLVGGHAALAALAYEAYDWSAGQLHADRAIALNPNHAETRAGYGQMLAAAGKFDEAVIQARLAHEIDPISPIIGTSLGFILEMAGQYEPAIQQLLRVRELDPNYNAAAWFLAGT